MAMLGTDGEYIVDPWAEGPFRSPRKQECVFREVTDAGECREVYACRRARGGETKRPRPWRRGKSGRLVWQGSVLITSAYQEGGRPSMRWMAERDVEGTMIDGHEMARKKKSQEKRESLPSEGNAPCFLVRLGEIAN